MPTTHALCRRRVPVERIDDPAVVREHHRLPDRRAESPAVDRCRACHERVRVLCTNEALPEEYDTAAALRGADRLTESLSRTRGTDRLSTDVRASDRVRRRGG